MITANQSATHPEATCDRFYALALRDSMRAVQTRGLPAAWDGNQLILVLDDDDEVVCSLYVPPEFVGAVFSVLWHQEYACCTLLEMGWIEDEEQGLMLQRIYAEN